MSSEDINYDVNTSTLLHDAYLAQAIALWRMLKKEHLIFMTQAVFLVKYMLSLGTVVRPSKISHPQEAKVGLGEDGSDAS